MIRHATIVTIDGHLVTCEIVQRDGQGLALFTVTDAAGKVSGEPRDHFGPAILALGDAIGITDEVTAATLLNHVATMAIGLAAGEHRFSFGVVNHAEDIQ